MRNMKILIHDERPDALEFLLEGIVKRGYKAGIAKDGAEIIHMLSDKRYNVVLTNGEYDTRQHQRSRTTSPSVCIISITNTQKRDEEMNSTGRIYLRRPFEASKLWKAIASNSVET
jgi:DNA-binding response OmpR family regulator